MRFWLGFGVQVLLWVGGIIGRAIDHIEARWGAPHDGG